MNEKMFNMADKILNTTCKIRYFLYGGTKRRSTWINSFMSSELINGAKLQKRNEKGERSKNKVNERLTMVFLKIVIQNWCFLEKGK